MKYLKPFMDAHIINSRFHTTNWIERLNRKYKRTIKMRTSMPTSKSVLFLLASVAMQETKTTYARKIHQWKFWKQKKEK